MTFLATLFAGVALATPGAQVPLSGVHNVSRWAYVMRHVTVRQQPDVAARPVGSLRTLTPEGETNLVLAYAAQRDADARLWIRVPYRPCRTAGAAGCREVRSATCTSSVRVSSSNRARLRAVLFRNGRAVFSTDIGVGTQQWPTPTGDFYIRVRLDHFTDPMYGPVAFGTNARSPWLTDWPKGGVVGIHGTDAPQLLPGRVSHGCIRMRNDAIERLARLLPLGTPVSIR